jgi:sugar phosphate permease
VGLAAQGALAAVHQGLPVLGPDLRDGYDLSLAGVGVVLGSVTLGTVLTLFAWGALADRAGERVVIASGLAGAALTLAVCAVAPGVGLLVGALVLTGMLGAAGSAASGRAVVGWFGPGERGLALGIRHMGTPLAGASAALLLPVCLLVGGLPAAFLALAAGSLLAALAAWRWLREPPAGLTSPAVAARPGSPVRDARIWLLAAGSALFVLAHVATVSFLVIWLNEDRGWSTAAAAGVLAATQLTGAAGRIAVGRWSDLLGARVRPLRWLVLAAAGLIGLGALTMDQGDWVTVPLIGLGCAAAMSGNALTQVATAELSGPGRAGAAMGLQSTILFAIVAVSAPLFGALVDATSWQGGFALLALAPLASWLVLRPLRAAV